MLGFQAVRPDLSRPDLGLRQERLTTLYERRVRRRLSYHFGFVGSRKLQGFILPDIVPAQTARLHRIFLRHRACLCDRATRSATQLPALPNSLSPGHPQHGYIRGSVQEIFAPSSLLHRRFVSLASKTRYRNSKPRNRYRGSYGVILADETKVFHTAEALPASQS